MDSQIGFILKVLLASTLLSLAIKYGGRTLAIAPTSLNAFIIVILPTAISLFVLLRQLRMGTGE